MAVAAPRSDDGVVNRSLAKALLALSYPLRMTAHLTDSAPQRSRASRALDRGSASPERYSRGA
jgi:hypothetical protein